MKYKLPFNVQLDRKYNDINVENFIEDWIHTKENRKDRIINMENDLHIELGKFSTYDIDINEIIDLGMRYALIKKEFRNMVAELIFLKGKEKNFFINKDSSNQ